VQAVYDAESIALLVRWHDMSAEKTGTNGPSLPVPAEEEQAAKPEAAGGAAGEASIWGEQAAPAGGAQPAQDPFADPFADPTTAAMPSSEFSDAVAIQIPSQVPTDARKPYFIFGDASNAVDLWFFDLAREQPLQFTGRGSADITPSDAGDVTGVASYDQGEWSAMAPRLRPASSCPWRSRSGTGSRASAATGEA
jgi:hypothetical protein